MVGRLNGDRVAGVSTHHRRSVCQVCGRTDPRKLVQALIPDSSAIDELELGADGYRLVTVCSDDELHALIALGRATWVDEQLWLGRLGRASIAPGMRRATLLAVARWAGLTHEQLRRVVAWNATRVASTESLPGGQLLR
ncbi:hypothetical protein [Amycolatopsis sp. NPDC050768]|uniref:hypothetical protein n=1 Tax=Amycolatopsis sp. NPDC050768 TaxID=3154839 RepID=UPI0033D02387